MSPENGCFQGDGIFPRLIPATAAYLSLRATRPSPRRGHLGSHSVAVFSEGRDDLGSIDSRQHSGATQIPLPLCGNAHLQMARASTAMLHLPCGGEAKTFFDTLVGFLLGHRETPETDSGNGETGLERDGPASQLAEASLGRQRADKAFAHLLRRRVGFSDFVELDKDIPHDALPFVNMGEFSAAKNDRHDHFVFVLQETLGLIHLELDIVIPRLGTETDLFDLGVVDVCFVLFLLLLIFELAEIHDPADRRLLVGSHLHQIEPRFAGTKQRLLGRNNAELSALGGDDADWRNPNLFVDAMLLLDGSRLRSRKGRRRPGSSRPLHPATGRTPPWNTPHEPPGKGMAWVKLKSACCLSAGGTSGKPR